MARLVALFLAAALSGASAADDYRGPTLAVADGFRETWTLANWDDGGPLTRYVFLNMTEFWAHSLIDRSGPVLDLAPTVRNDVANFVATLDRGELRLAEYMDDPAVDAMIVLHQGRVVFERYPRMHPQDKHLWMSVSKPVASTLIGILAGRGRIDVSQPVDAYLTEFAGSGWDGVSVLDVLDMASGIDCRQAVPGAYEDPSTCYYQFEAALGWLPPTDATAADVHAWVAALDGRRPPGEAFEYSSVNTFVLRWLVERVSGKPYAAVLEQEIWQQMGAESDALLAAPKRGIPVAASGISSTLRDLARFGLLFTPTGRMLTRAVVTDELLDAIRNGGRPELLEAAADDGNERLVEGEAPFAASRQWDYVMQDGDFYKGGYGGQGLYVSPSRDLVIAFFGTLDTDGRISELSRVARQLAVSGLFD